MKILHTADWHLGKRLHDHSRLPEQREVLAEICEVAEREAVDVVLIAGDLYDTFKPSNEATELFYRTVHRLADQGRRAVVAIAGNHDSADGVQAPDPLARECGIVFLGRPTSTVPLTRLKSGLEITRSAPGFVELCVPSCGCPLRLLLTPYANEALMRRFLGTEEREEALRQLLEEHWRTLADEHCDPAGVNLLMAHLYVMRADGPPPEEPDDERPILYLGGAQAIHTANLPPQIQYAALGHLHRHQVVSREPCPVVYSSSPLAYSFSEADQSKYVVIVEAEPGQPVRMRPVELTSGRRLKRRRFDDVDEAVAWLTKNPDTFVELTLVSDTYVDAATKKRLYDAHDGIVGIIPELKLPDGPAGSDALRRVDVQQDLRALFRNYFAYKRRQQPNDVLLSLFDEVVSVREDA
ncbi:MAG: exonuclease subunit SbcD [Catalinimonas sp.]